MSKELNLMWPDYLELCNNLYAKLKGEKFNNLVIIGTGGWIVGKIINKWLKLPIYTLICKSYENKRHGDFESTIIIPEKEIQGKVLIIDDLIDTGETMNFVVNYLKAHYKKIERIKIAVLIKKSNSLITPDYYILETKDWVNFPYESE